MYLWARAVRTYCEWKLIPNYTTETTPPAKQHDNEQHKLLDTNGQILTAHLGKETL